MFLSKLFSKRRRTTGAAVEPAREKYDFLHRWFDGHIPNWRRWLSHLRQKRARMLEIGAFEGGSTTWILEELCCHPESCLISIDTFEGSPATRECAQTKLVLPALEQRFLANIKKTGKSHKHSYHRTTSFEWLCDMNCQGVEPFDFIYIDGSHGTMDVLTDAVLAWPLLAKGGLLIFDDYHSGGPPGPRHPKTAIDAFLGCVQSDIEVIELGLQAVMKRIN